MTRMTPKRLLIANLRGELDPKRRGYSSVGDAMESVKEKFELGELSEKQTLDWCLHNLDESGQLKSD